MTTIKRLADSCLLVSTDEGVTLVDPGFFTFESGQVDLETIGQVDHVLVTHEHRDHASPPFISWLRDRSPDVTVHCSEAVAAILREQDISSVTDALPGHVAAEDATHEPLPDGSAPPNRAYTISGAITHPGDSFSPSTTAPVLALPLVAPWGSMTQSVSFAKRLAPHQVIPIHDFFTSPTGQDFLYGLAARFLGESDIEFVPLRWNESFTV